MLFRLPRVAIAAFLQERLGCAYIDFRLEDWPTTFFYVVMLTRCMAQGIIVGVQQGEMSVFLPICHA